MNMLVSGDLALIGLMSVFNMYPDPTPAFRFYVYVEVAGILSAGFNEVSGLGAQREIKTYKEGGVNEYTHKLTGHTNYTNVKLTQGVTFSSSLWDWYATGASTGNVKRASVTIIQYSPYYNLPARWYHLEDAYPVSWTGSTLNAGSSDISVESVELAYSEMEMDTIGDFLGIGTVLASNIAGGIARAVG